MRQPQHLDSWTEWRDALLRDFAGEHIRDWAYIQLQERRQLPGETPRQYVTSILQLCARANTSMTESEKVRCLIRGLRPEMMERVAISNPKTATDFLQHLQRLTHVGTMAQHAMAAMPRHALPGFVAASPFAPGADTSPGASMLAASHNRSGNSEEHANTRNPDTPDQSQMLTVLQESIKALTIAMERIAAPPARRFPSNPSRNARGQVICFRCHQGGPYKASVPGTAARNKQVPTSAGAGKLGERGSGVSPRISESHSAVAVSAHYLPTHLITIPVSVQGKDTLMIIDTGASVNIASRDFVSRIGATIRPTTAIIRDVGSKLIRAAGEVQLAIKIGPVEIEETLLVLDSLPYDLLGGLPLCQHAETVISFTTGTISFCGRKMKLNVNEADLSMRSKAVAYCSETTRIPPFTETTLPAEVEMDGACLIEPLRRSTSKDSPHVARTLADVRNKEVHRAHSRSKPNIHRHDYREGNGHWRDYTPPPRRYLCQTTRINKELGSRGPIRQSA
ncbi:hypothetical protein MTO96_046275 [Rhipicephalus appendiculatus]